MSRSILSGYVAAVRTQAFALSLVPKSDTRSIP
jgi:hypothetical protein